jgi:hypothetical protein
MSGQTYIVLLVLGAGSTTGHTLEGAQVGHAAAHATHAGHTAKLGEVDVAEATVSAAGATILTTKATEVVCVVILASLILLILIHPLSSISNLSIIRTNRQSYLVEVSLEEVHLLGAAEETGPELRLELLLAENELDITVGVVDLAVLGVDLGVEVERDAVCYALTGGALESNILLGDAESSLGLGNIGGLDVDVEVVALRLRVGGTLSPGN